MPETVGGVVYEVEVSTVKGEKQLRDFEQKAERTSKASSDRLNRLQGLDTAAHFEQAQVKALQEQYGLTEAAALATVRGVEKVEGASIKAASATAKFTTQQQALRTAVRSGAASLYNEAPVLGRVGSGFGVLAAAAPQVAVGVIGIAAAFSVLDAASKRFTGSGIIDQLTGEAKAHKLAAEAAREQGDALQFVAALEREGVSKEVARQTQLAKSISDVTLAIKQRNAAVLESISHARELPVPPTQFKPGPGGVPIAQPATSGGVGPALDKYNASLDQAVKNVLDLKPNLEELYKLMAVNPDLTGVKAFADYLKLQEEAAGAAAVEIAHYNVAIDQAIAASAGFDDAVSSVKKLLDLNLDPTTAALELERTKLEQLKTTLGDAFGEGNQARLDELTRRLSVIGAQQDVVNAGFDLFGAIVRENYDDAESKIRLVGSALAKLPEEERIKLTLILPDLAHVAEVFDRFIASLQRGATVKVALQFSAQGAFPGNDQTIDVLPGIGSPVTTPGLSPGAQKIIDDYTKSIDDFNAAASAGLGPIEDNEKATKAAAKATDIWADGIIDLGEALDEGLNPAQAAALELTHDAEKAVWSLADAEFRLAVETEKAKQGTVSLQIGLVAIAAELVRTGQTAEQFDLVNRIQPALDELASALDEIFSKPTREGLQFDKQLHTLKRQALELERGGADAGNVGRKDKKGNEIPASAADRALKKVNDQITALQREIDIREEEFAIMKDETLLRDQNLQTDKDLINANAYIATALTELSGEAAKASDAIGIRLFDSAMRAATALDVVGAAGGTGFTAAEKHWINGVATGRGEPVPFPGFAKGIAYIPHPMTAMLHTGERVLTAEENKRYRAGGETTVNIYGATDADLVMRKVVRALDDRDRARGFAGATSLPHANAPRG